LGGGTINHAFRVQKSKELNKEDSSIRLVTEIEGGGEVDGRSNKKREYAKKGGKRLQLTWTAARIRGKARGERNHTSEKRGAGGGKTKRSNLKKLLKMRSGKKRSSKKKINRGRGGGGGSPYHLAEPNARETRH